jgi:hypothetical protein
MTLAARFATRTSLRAAQGLNRTRRRGRTVPPSGGNPGGQRVPLPMRHFLDAEIVGKPMLLLFPPERIDEESDILARLTRGESVDPFENPASRRSSLRRATGRQSISGGPHEVAVHHPWLPLLEQRQHLQMRFPTTSHSIRECEVERCPGTHLDDLRPYYPSGCTARRCLERGQTTGNCGSEPAWVAKIDPVHRGSEATIRSARRAKQQTGCRWMQLVC